MSKDVNRFFTLISWSLPIVYSPLLLVGLWLVSKCDTNTLTSTLISAFTGMSYWGICSFLMWKGLVRYNHTKSLVFGVSVTLASVGIFFIVYTILSISALTTTQCSPTYLYTSQIKNWLAEGGLLVVPILRTIYFRRYPNEN